MRTDVGFTLPVSTTFPQVSEPKGKKKVVFGVTSSMATF